MRTSPFACGTFNGTGAAIYLCLGFMPEWFRLKTLETGTGDELFWNIHMMRASETSRGVLVTGSSGAEDMRAISGGETGVACQYPGGITTDATSWLAPIEVVKGAGYRNQRLNRAVAPNTLVTRWTLDTLGSRTGHFDYSIDTTYVGEGSLVIIDGVCYGMNALSNDGDAANDVTLSYAAPSGRVDAIYPMYDYVQMASGVQASAGLYLDLAATPNATNDLVFFEAGIYSGA